MGAEEVKNTKKGAKAYTYFMASWREGGKMKNVYLGSSQRMSREDAQEQARALKRDALGPSSITPSESGNFYGIISDISKNDMELNERGGLFSIC